MKFNYEYRTSDNVRHECTITAASREAAFDALRAQGIKPGRLVEAPGLLNKVFGKGKRWIAIVVLAVASIVAVLFALNAKQEAENASRSYADAEGNALPIDRRQIWGDDAVIAQAAKQNWRVIFPNPACRLLALFAQPGQLLAVMPRIPPTIAKDFDAALATKERIAENDLDEYKQMKCIVEGMKKELRDYLAAGGKLNGYVRRLQQRQKEESDYINLAKEELQKEVAAGKDAMASWQAMNRRLRDQGLPALPLPE